MKRKLFTIVWGLWMLSCSILGMLPVTAQKTKSQSLVTQEQINKINDLVKPLKDQIDKQLNEDGTGMYKAYQEDIRKLNSAGSEKERRSYSKK